jgi:hypothetical protein
MLHVNNRVQMQTGKSGSISISAYVTASGTVAFAPRSESAPASIVIALAQEIASPSSTRSHPKLHFRKPILFHNTTKLSNARACISSFLTEHFD